MQYEWAPARTCYSQPTSTTKREFSKTEKKLAREECSRWSYICDELTNVVKFNKHQFRVCMCVCLSMFANENNLIALMRPQTTHIHI